VKISFSGYDLAFPLMTGTESGAGQFDSNNQIFGTAFLLGSGCLMTAGHVAKALQAATGEPLLAIPRPTGVGNTAVTRVTDIELLPHDLAIVRVPITKTPSIAEPIIPWFSGAHDVFAEVYSFGFPYGLLPAGTSHQFIQRVFRGHVVSSPARYELPTDSGKPVAVFELSFPAPRGLSGAPLLLRASDGRRDPSLIGVVVGNSSQSMLVHTSTERESSTNETLIVERHESLNLGIAVQCKDALPLRSRILGSTIVEYLSARGALRKAEQPGR
jgi:hypothetical protein